MAKKSRHGGVGTPATRELDRLGIAYEVRAYEHDAAETSFGQEAAAKLGIDPARVYKTLLAEADGALIVGIVPVDGRLDLKALSHAAGAKRAGLADPALAERKTGYVVGGISPIGQKTSLRTFLDEGALAFDTVLVSGGRRGLDVELTPGDLLTATRGTTAPIARRG